MFAPVSAIDDQCVNLPTEFYLLQNNPNAFNPATIIRYQIPDASFVSLKVFDALGSEVATLVNEPREAGRYEIIFDGRSVPSGLASGIYFYELKAGRYISARKMILIR